MGGWGAHSILKFTKYIREVYRQPREAAGANSFPLKPSIRLTLSLNNILFHVDQLGINDQILHLLLRYTLTCMVIFQLQSTR